MRQILYRNDINRGYKFNRKKTEPKQNSSENTITPFYKNKLVQASFIIGVCLLASKLPLCKKLIKKGKKIEQTTKNEDVFTHTSTISPKDKPIEIKPVEPKPANPETKESNSLGNKMPQTENEGEKIIKIKPVNIKPANIHLDKNRGSNKKNNFDPLLKLSDEEKFSRIFHQTRSMWFNKGSVSPLEIDKILTKHIGLHKKREIKFIPDKKQGITLGRKVSYLTKKGSVFILEAHDGPKGIETRCYIAKMNHKTLLKKDRLYLCTDGIFEPGMYYSQKTHLKSSEDTIDWIRLAEPIK